MKRTITIGILVALAAGAGFLAGVGLASRGAAHRQRNPARTAASAPPAAQGKRRILYWWDPMIGPASISPQPGVSAMGMKLVPVYAPTGASSRGEVTIDPAIQQSLAIETSRVRIGSLHKSVRTVGYVRQARPVSYAVTLRVSGWIGALYAATDGTAIRKGDALFTLYSPQLLAAQQELLAAAQNRALASRARDPESVAEAQRLYRSIEQRLLYLGVSAAQLEHIVARRKAEEYLTFLSPVSGYLAGVSVRQHSFIASGRPVMRIEQLGTVWLDAEVYENQLPWVRLGERMRAHIASDPGRTLTGRISFIDPDEDPRTHTVTVRAQLNNPAGLLRPGMYALIDIAAEPLTDVLLAPASAIIHTGSGEVALLAQGKGRFMPQKVTTGLAGSEGMVQVLSGLEEGERVVTSGQFLIDVESNMNELTTKLAAGERARGQAATSGATGRSAPGMKMPPARQRRSSAAKTATQGDSGEHPAAPAG